ncbi:MAG TPA: DNA glycosylase [Clostridia bacterium]
MEILVDKGKIVIDNPDSFKIKDILDCGQVFRYNIFSDYAEVLSKDHYARIIEQENKITIECDDAQYFYNYFDLDTDYNSIKQKLRVNPLMCTAIDFGQGIRILKGDLFEILISFIISANNNIGRIKKSLNFISKHLGRDMGGYYAFPELSILAQADEKFFVSAGCGYRSPYLVHTLKYLNSNPQFLQELKTRDTAECMTKLMTLKGVGEKVADCILLFGLHRTDVFPVDTWINKVYKENFEGTLTNRKNIRGFFINLFGQLSGYAQQYLFYYKRSGNV